VGCLARFSIWVSSYNGGSIATLESPTGSDRLGDLGGKKERMLGTVLIIVVVLLLIGALPTWPYSNGWGYYPSGGLGLILLVVLLLLLLGRI
jgi:Protein of unknown function (DUF3309)